MRFWTTTVIVFAVIFGLCTCSTKHHTIGFNAAPTITSAIYDAVARLLTVIVEDTNNDNVTVTVTEPAGLHADSTSKAVAGGHGNAVFTWTAVAPEAGGNGDTTVTATDGITTTPATQVVHVTVAPVLPLQITAVNVTDLTNGTARLTVTVADTNNNDATVSVTNPAGMTADNGSRTVTGGNGNAVFIFSAANASAGASGTTTITADDGHGGTASTTQAVAIAAIGGLYVNAATATDLGDGTARLTVTVVDVDNLDVSVTVDTPPGTEVDQPLAVVPTGNGDAVFTYSAVDQSAGASGDVTITVFDTLNRTVSLTQTIAIAPVPVPTGPVIGAVSWVDHNDGSGTLSVPVTDTANADVTVSVSALGGATVDNASKPVAGGNGTAAFVFTETTAGAGAAGDVTATASEGGHQDTATVALTIAHRILVTPPTVVADTLYVYPLQSVAVVGEPVEVFVVSGEPAHFLSFLSSVGVTVETAGTYVPSSFNIGLRGGARLDTDGYWALLGPPSPANGAYLDLGDSLVPGPATDIGGGFHRYNFAVVTQGTFPPPASWPAGGAMLFNFQLSFSAPGTYHLGFQLNDGTFDQTYYSDWSSSYFWGTLDNSYTITVN